MNDFWNDPDWRREGAALDALMAKYSRRSFPPGLLEAYIDRQMAVHKAVAAEIERVFTEAAVDLAVMERFNRRF